MNSQALFCLVQPHQLLQKNNVKLTHHDADGHFSLKRGEQEIEINCGVWAAVWINNFLASKVEGVSPFPLGFSLDNPKYRHGVGLLGKSSPKLASTFKGLRGLELDFKMADVFASNKVELGDEGSKLQDLKTAYVMDTIEPYPASEFLEATRDSLVYVDSKWFRNEAPFYLAIDVKSEDPPRIWTSFIEDKRLHWNMRDGILYLSNAYSVKMGLPPNHEILGFDLALGTKRVRPAVNKRTLELVQATIGAWEYEFADFMENPSLATFLVLRTKNMRKTLKLYKNTSYYNSGSTRKYKLTTKVMQRFSGPASAASFNELAQAVEEIAGDDTIVQFCLLMKLEGQVKLVQGDGQDADRFYFDN